MVAIVSGCTRQATSSHQILMPSGKSWRRQVYGMRIITLRGCTARSGRTGTNIWSVSARIFLMVWLFSFLLRKKQKTAPHHWRLTRWEQASAAKFSWHVMAVNWQLMRTLTPFTTTTALYGSRYRIKSYSGLRSEEHTSELQSRFDLVCRLLLEKKKNNINVVLYKLTIT